MDGALGFFPANYVELCEAPPLPSVPSDEALDIHEGEDEVEGHGEASLMPHHAPGLLVNPLHSQSVSLPTGETDASAYIDQYSISPGHATSSAPPPYSTATATTTETSAEQADGNKTGTAQAAAVGIGLAGAALAASSSDPGCDLDIAMPFRQAFGAGR